MGIFNLFKKKGKNEEQIEKTEHKSSILLAMPIFKNNETYNINEVIENLKTLWGFNVNIGEGASDETTVFDIDGQIVAIAKMPTPVPWKEIEETASFNYMMWPDAAIELKDHTSHAIVTVLSSNKSAIDRYFILSKILCSILLTSNCVGIYQGSQTLLISKENYLNRLEDIRNNEVPVPLWVYIGIRTDANKISSLYTYGLTGFGKKETEIINSEKDIEELYNLLINISGYVIGCDVTLKDGETIGYTDDMKIPITLSKGVLLDGETLKLSI